MMDLNAARWPFRRKPGRERVTCRGGHSIMLVANQPSPDRHLNIGSMAQLSCH